LLSNYKASAPAERSQLFALPSTGRAPVRYQAFLRQYLYFCTGKQEEDQFASDERAGISERAQRCEHQLQFAINASFALITPT
jgi:hypothetical protein